MKEKGNDGDNDNDKNKNVTDREERRGRRGEREMRKLHNFYPILNFNCLRLLITEC